MSASTAEEVNTTDNGVASSHTASINNSNNIFSKTKSFAKRTTASMNMNRGSTVPLPTPDMSGVNSAMSNLFTPIANLATRKYTLPDKTVASQVLMYRQLLHTECKPGLRLSRGFEGTPAQRAVMHMPWWEQGVEQSKRMVISYNNLIVRLWLNGAIMPYVDGGYASEHSSISLPKDDDHEALRSSIAAKAEQQQQQNLLDLDSPPAEETSETNDAKDDNDGTESTSHIDTLIDSQGLPPIPHPYWVDRLGFQQTNPVTDFRSGGVLSLAMLCHLVEACPAVHARFLPSGDTHMLPYGITCINVTDMIAKFCMFSKSVDRIDALLSQKPFWRMFADPNALLVLQELSMDMLCDVVAEMGKERKLKILEEQYNAVNGGGSKKDGRFHGQDKEGKVTVFDFSEILNRTEKRVRDDLLGSGPKTVVELRSIHFRICQKYQKAMAKKERIVQRNVERQKMAMSNNGQQQEEKKIEHMILNATPEPLKAMTGNVMDTAGNVMGKAGGVVGKAGGVWDKYKGKLNFRNMGNSSPSNKDDAVNDLNERYSTEEIDFTTPPSTSSSNEENNEMPRDFSTNAGESVPNKSDTGTIVTLPPTSIKDSTAKTDLLNMEDDNDFDFAMPSGAAGAFTIDDDDEDDLLS